MCRVSCIENEAANWVRYRQARIKQAAYKKVWDHSVVLQAEIFPYRSRELAAYENPCRP